jgi:hypothetical protein
MSGEDLAISEEAPEKAPPKKKRNTMVNVYNSHRFRSFHLGGGCKIGPGQTGRIPNAMFEKVKDSCGWLKRAERGDVI